MKIHNTPWGAVQQQEEIGGGIVSVSTAGHGGLYVPQSMYDVMPAALRINAYGGGTWFEEDCEWALVALAHPQYFDARSMFYAVKTIQHYAQPDSQYYTAYKWLIDTDAGRALIAAHSVEPISSEVVA